MAGAVCQPRLSAAGQLTVECVQWEVFRRQSVVFGEQKLIN